MLTRLAHLSVRRSWRVVIAAVLFVVVAGALGGGVAENLTSGGFEDPATESSRADDALAERFDTGVPNVILLVTATDGDVDAPDVAAAGQALTDELAAEAGVTDVLSYWSEGNAPPLRSEDGNRARGVAPSSSPASRATTTPSTSGSRSSDRPTSGRATASRSPSRSAASPRCSTRSGRPSRRTWSPPR
jgi:uncharacterized membrane protein YdfJ with MMPL/SSD domain